jgi:hypothetical protein
MILSGVRVDAFSPKKLCKGEKVNSYQREDLCQERRVHDPEVSGKHILYRPDQLLAMLEDYDMLG